ncbi:MAG: hypothetical protein JKY43_05930 [Phycisphaerales bacterium]|nr:hypothetical protein [Phycisphaerales bacterium]
MPKTLMPKFLIPKNAPLIISLLVVTSSWAVAQPQNDPPPQQDRPTKSINPNTPLSPDALRKRLLHTLNFAKRIVEKHEAALAQLDAGDNPRQVMRELRTSENRKTMRNTQRLNAYPMDQTQENPDDPRTPPSPTITPEDIIQVREFVEKNLPTIDAHLKQIESLSPKATDPLVARLAPKVLEILHLRDQNSAMSSLKLDELKAGLAYTNASRRYRVLLKSASTDTDALTQAEQQVRNAASARFDAQVHIKQYEIHQLTQRIQQLHAALEELNAQRQDQVEAQVQSAQHAPKSRKMRHRKNSSNTNPKN